MIQKLGHRFVKASTNLEGSANERLSRIIKNKAQLQDTSMEERIQSLLKSQQQNFIPENSINYIA